MQPRDVGAVDLDGITGADTSLEFDQFDLMQLPSVIDICRKSHSLSDAGRKLFNVTREAEAKPNDADRLKKYLARCGLDWADVTSRER